MTETKLRYSEPLLREAVRAFVFQAVRGLFSPLFLVACTMITASLTSLLRHGDHSWVVGLLAACPLMIGAFVAIIYLAHFRNTVGKFREMRVPEGTLSCEEEQFTLASEMGSLTLPWSAVKEVRQYPRFWLMVFSPSQFTTLPLDCLDDATRAFISRKTSSEPILHEQ